MLVENVQRLCDSKGITIWALERATGIGNGVIAKWVDKNPRINSLKKVADYFGVTVDSLLQEATDA